MSTLPKRLSNGRAEAPTSHDVPPSTRPWRERWLQWRDRRLVDPKFREAATRSPLTRPVAQRQARELFDLVAGFVYSQWLAASVELRLFERLAREPMSAAQLATECELPLDSALRLFEATASLRLTQSRDPLPDGTPRWGLGPLGAALVDNPAVLAMVQHHQTLYADLANPLALLRRGPGGGELSRYWSYASAAEPGSLPGGSVAPYSALMAASQPLVAGQVLDAYPIQRHRKLLDLGGGEGAFVTEALQRAPDLVATVFDLPAVAQRAQLRLKRLGLHGRAQVVGGDFHRDVLPQGADVISLIRVVYDHDDDHALAVLRAARRALPVGGTLLLAEPMADTAGAQTMGAAYFGMYLLAMGKGRSRSAAQLTALLRQTGFGDIEQRRTAIPLQAGLLVATAV